MVGAGARARLRASAWMLALVLAVTVGVASPGASARASEASGWLHTDGSSIVTADGAEYTIRAVSWFGMETSNCAPHGLWSIPLDDGMSSIAAMDFTTVRVPYSNECLAASTVTGIDQNANPALVALTPLQVLDAVVASAKAHGLNVILDRHRPGSDAQSELWYTARFDEQRWIDDWTMLASRYRDEPAVIGADLHNEPHGAACWGCGDAAVDWHAAATRAGDAVLSANPNLLIIVEGVERQADGSSTWWGGGLGDAGSLPVTLSVTHRVVYSPHEYPSTVYAQKWFSASDYPANLTGIWDANWGYLHKEGIAPVLLGEFGTTLQTDSDRVWLDTLVGYLAENGMSFAYWSFNPNSGDTGGLVADDWRTPQGPKLEALRPILAPADVPMAAPVPTPTTAPSPIPSPAQKPPRTPITSKPTTDAGWKKPSASKPTTSPLAGPPSRTLPSPPTLAHPSPSGEPGVSAIYSLQSAWDEGYVAELDVTATGTTRGWTASWRSPGATAVVGAWGMSCVVADEVITCTGADWAASPEAGQTVRVGLQVASASAPQAPAVTVTAS